MGVGLFGGQSPEIVGRLDPVTGKMDLHDLTVVSFGGRSPYIKKILTMQRPIPSNPTYRGR